MTRFVPDDSMQRGVAFAAVCALSIVAWLAAPHLGGQTRNAPADLLIVNSNVYTADGTGRFVQAVAIGGGIVLRVGSNQEVQELRGPSTNVIDARGRAVVPGFNDSHVHFLAGGLGLGQVDLAGLQTLTAVQARIRAFAAAHGSAPWVRGRGWLYSPFPGGLPTREQLDAAVPDRPAAMSCYDGHSLWVNSKALMLAGITKGTPDPKNGVIVKDPKTGEPTGVLEESAQALVRGVLPQPSHDEQRAALRAAVAEALRFGLTSVQNASGSPEELEMFDEARRAGDLKVRYYSTLSIQPGFTPSEADRYDQVRTRYGDDPVLKTGAVKIVLDGVIESRTAAMLDSYTNSPSAGAPNYSREDLERIVTMMDARGWQIWVHAIGDRAIRMALDAFEHAAAVNPAPPRGPRHRIEHIEAVAAADISRFGRLAVIASQQPMHVVLGDMNADEPSGPWPNNVGRERATRAWAWNNIRAAGGRLTFGSDWAVAPLAPGEGIWLATTRTVSHGAQDQKLALTDAIDGYTRWPAYASFEEQRKGMLAPGMLADLAILSTDVFANPPLQAGDLVVDVTIANGTVVYRRDAEAAR
jgi:predicted amidohydrolase YtcJ